MIGIECLVFGLWTILSFVPDQVPMTAVLQSSFIEQYDCGNKASSSVPAASSTVAWVEIPGLRRKQRPYRNPLRKLRKQLRQARKARRRIEKKAGKESSDKKSVADLKDDSIAGVVQDVERIPIRNKSGRPATIATKHVFCPTEGCRGFQVIGPHPDHWPVVVSHY